MPMRRLLIDPENPLLIDPENQIEEDDPERIHNIRRRVLHQNVSSAAAGMHQYNWLALAHLSLNKGYAMLMAVSTASSAHPKQRAQSETSNFATPPIASTSSNFLEVPNSNISSSATSSPEPGRRSPFLRSLKKFKRRSMSEISIMLDFFRGGSSVDNYQLNTPMIRHRTCSPYSSVSERWDGGRRLYSSSVASFPGRSKSRRRHLTLPKKINWERLSPQNIQRQMQMGDFLHTLWLCGITKKVDWLHMDSIL